MAAPPNIVAHKPHFHRDAAWKQPVRCATTAAITIATGLNAGDAIDGVTLVAGDRVLVKDQAAGAENGIYAAGATPARAFDMDVSSEVVGALVLVVEGTVNGGTLWRATNTATPTLGTTALAFAQAPAAADVPIADTSGFIAATDVEAALAELAGITVISPAQLTANTDNWNPTDLATADVIRVSTDASRNLTGIVAPSVARELLLANIGAQDLVLVHDATSTAANRFYCPNDANVTLAKDTTIGLAYDLTSARWRVVGGTGGSALTVADEGTPLATDATTLDFVGAGVVASGTGATKTITISGGGSGITIEEVDGTPTVTATKLVLPNGTLGVVGTVATYTPATGAADDPIADIFGTPDTAFEFDTTSLTGLTAVGSATAEDADTTVPGHYYVTRAATASAALSGRYAAATPPFTAVVKLSASTVAAVNYCRVGHMFIGEATPGGLETVVLVHDADWTVGHQDWANPTTFTANIGTAQLIKAVAFPLYYCIVVNSSTDVDFWWSFDGRIWRKRTDARNPGFTVGSVGIIVDPENATIGAAAAFDFLRIWNSVKTPPGI